MPARKYHYTAETDAVIREVYQDAKMFRVKSVKVAAQRLGWPPYIVKYRAAMLGLTRTRDRPWEKEELLILDRWAHQHPARIQRKLKAAGFDRTQPAIVNRRYELKLLSCLDGYNALELGQLFGVDSHRITAWIERGWLRGERHSDGPPHGRNRWFIPHASVFRFALEHPNEYDLGKVSKVWFLDLVTQGSMVWTGKYKPQAGAWTLSGKLGTRDSAKHA